ncbi:MAG: hypothetical protein K2G69_08010 [Muribaculaceae bacterium]|nr:hypothetical protein [Muribaculaceae bacterium]
MKKSIIWLLTVVMAITFGALLYFQIMYLENMVKMREEQFSETVMRCLSSTSSYLERKETLHFLEEDVNIIESSLLEDNSFSSSNPKVPSQEATKIGNNQQVGNLEKRYRDMQEVIRSQYLYQKGLLNEVILSDHVSREHGQNEGGTIL